MAAGIANRNATGTLSWKQKREAESSRFKPLLMQRRILPWKEVGLGRQATKSLEKKPWPKPGPFFGRSPEPGGARLCGGEHVIEERILRQHYISEPL